MLYFTTEILAGNNKGTRVFLAVYSTELNAMEYGGESSREVAVFEERAGEIIMHEVKFSDLGELKPEA